MGYCINNVDGVLVVQTPEGNLVGCLNPVLELKNGDFFLSSDVWQCNFKLGDIDEIGDGEPPWDTDDRSAFYTIIKLFPK